MKQMQRIQVSLILPTYNDHRRLRVGLNSSVVFLKKQSFTWEIIIIDDGSDSLIQLDKKYRLLPIHVYRLDQNKGKGAAIRYGVKKAKGDAIVFSDVDFSVDIQAILPLLALLKKHPIVIASRRIKGAHIATHQTFLRECAGRIFTFLSNTICNTQVADATCGFKGFEAKTGRFLFGKSLINAWVFDTEILFLARRRGIPIVEMPVTWKDKKGSKVTFFAMVQSIVDLVKIRWFDLTRVYEMRSL